MHEGILADPSLTLRARTPMTHFFHPAQVKPTARDTDHEPCAGPAAWALWRSCTARRGPGLQRARRGTFGAPARHPNNGRVTVSGQSPHGASGLSSFEERTLAP